MAKIPESHVGKGRIKEGAVRGGRESNLIPLFVLLEIILPLSGAGSKVVTPERWGSRAVGGV